MMLNREYNLADPEMIQFSKVYKQLYLNNAADFAALDPDFNGDFADDWQSAINASESTDSAETRADQLSQETAEVSDAMKTARRIYNQAKYFIVKAFKDKPGIMDEFGLNNYGDVAGNVAAMVAFLANLHQKAEYKYKAALNAAGVTQARIDEIAAVKNTLSAEETGQEVYKKENVAATADRITTHNATWAFVKKVNDASKALYYDNPVKLNLFLLPRDHEPDTAVFNILGTVTDANTAAPLRDVTVSIPDSAITTNTDTNGQYGLAGITTGNYTLQFSADGYVTQTATVNVAAENTQYIVDVHLASV